MISEKKITEQPVNCLAKVTFNKSIGSYGSGVVYKVGRICTFSVIAVLPSTGTNQKIATVSSDLIPIASRTNLSVEKYGESTGSECYINDSGEIIIANAETGDYKISGVWVTAS